MKHPKKSDPIFTIPGGILKNSTDGDNTLIIVFYLNGQSSVSFPAIVNQKIKQTKKNKTKKRYQIKSNNLDENNIF